MRLVGYDIRNDRLVVIWPTLNGFHVGADHPLSGIDYYEWAVFLEMLLDYIEIIGEL